MPLIAISDSQRRFFPDLRWVATIHHGLPLEGMPFSERPGDYLAFVGRITPEKGIREAIELQPGDAGPAACRGQGATWRRSSEHFEEVVQPAIDAHEMEFLGEVGPLERDPLYAGALATVMLGGWPEPFGLVAIESMATGTPVIARRAGALTETIEHGVTGFLVDDVGEAVLAVERIPELDRRRIRELHARAVLAGRMVDEYERAYRAVLAERSPPARPAVPTSRSAAPRPSRARPAAGADRPLEHVVAEDLDAAHDPGPGPPAPGWRRPRSTRPQRSRSPGPTATRCGWARRRGPTPR